MKNECCLYIYVGYAVCLFEEFWVLLHFSFAKIGNFSFASYLFTIFFHASSKKPTQIATFATHSSDYFMVNQRIIPILLLITFLTSACGSKSGSDAGGTDIFTSACYTPSDATGFSITSAPDGESTLLTVGNPWQGADSVASRLLLLRGGEEVPDGFQGAVLREGKAKRIVAMSSTYIAMLDALDELDRVAAVSGMRYIANENLRSRADRIIDVGNEQNADFELLVAAQPDLVLLYGVGGPSAMASKLDQLGIPYIYIGDYLEQSPLGKAEWIVAIGEIVGRRDKAIAFYNAVKARYEALTASVDSMAARPKVMLNSPYGDSWFMPGTENYMVRLINDAGGDYMLTENVGDTSVPVDMEKAYMLVGEADVWLNPGQITSNDELQRLLPRFADAEVVRHGRVFNNNARSTEAGGNDFYESGTLNPDLILADLIAIFRGSEPQTYYKQLK